MPTPDGTTDDGRTDEPPWTPPPIGTLAIANEAATAIGLTSHIHLAEVNPRLRLDRSAAFGNRLAIATGETVWIRPGETVTLPMTPIAGARVLIGTSGVVDGELDDPATRDRALATLRACGYLDVVEGESSGTIAGAAGAIAAIMRHDRATGA